MPANLSPEYKAAEAAFRKARVPRERLEWLREMLRTIPKHKGTDHLQADIKGRIRELSDELEAPRRRATRGGPALVVRPEGAAQIALIGPPNSGKSLLHARLTGSAAHVGPYPFALQFPTLMLANKAERIADIGAEIDAFHELAGARYPVLAVSAATGLGVGEIAPWLFDHLGIVRVYTKTPGHPPDRDRPFTRRRRQSPARRSERHPRARRLGARLALHEPCADDPAPGDRVRHSCKYGSI